MNIRTLLALCLVLSACSKSNSGPGTPAGGPAQQDDGTSSGGGSFGDENSMTILKWTKELLASSIRNSNPAVFEGLPKEWSQERLAKLIENVKAEPNKAVFRYQRELMFDYRVPKTGEPYLVATSLFFRSHAAVPINSMWPTTREPYLREVRTKLMHEAAHVLGIGTSESSDYKARVFAMNLIGYVLHKNNVVCVADDVPTNYPGYVTTEQFEREVFQIQKRERPDITTAETFEKQDELAKAILTKDKPRHYYWIFSRSTGFAIHLHSSVYESRLIARPSIANLIAGKPAAHGSFSYLESATKNSGVLNSGQELKREFEFEWMRSSIVANGETPGLKQQYYATAKFNPDNKITFTGLSEFSGESSCENREEITIPRSSEGSITAKIKFNQSCLGEPKNGEFEVQCKESLVKIGTLDEFYGESAFKDPELKRLASEIGMF